MNNKFFAKLRLICVVLMMLMPVAIQASDVKYHLSGQFPDSLNGKKVYLYLIDTARRLLDTTYVRNGHFLLTGTYPLAGRASLVLSNGNITWEHVNFALENTPVTFTYDGHSLRAKGGPLTLAQQEYDQIVKERGIALKYNVAMPSGSELLMGAKLNEEQLKEIERVNLISDSVNHIFNLRLTEFVWRNKDNAIGGRYFNEFSRANDVAAQDSLLACAGKEFLSSPIVIRELASRKQSPGQPYSDFEMTDKDGNKHRLSEYVGSGRYVLLDVWASWCLGCRLEIPHVKEVYEKYKDRGFDVVLVSIDATKGPWLKAIAKDGSESLGHHLLDAKSICRKAYGISAIPFNILINPQGIIVGTNLRNEGLTKKLEEIFK